MRKTLRILYLVCMLLFFSLLFAACFSFSGTVTSLVTAQGSSSGNLLVRTSTSLDFDAVFFSLSHWEARTGKAYQCSFDPSSMTLNLIGIDSASSLEFGEYEASLHICAILGFLFSSLGTALSTVGRNSKPASIAGAGFLLAGSILFFCEPSIGRGMHYELFFSSEEGIEDVFKISAPWIDLRIISAIASSLGLAHLFLLLKTSKEQKNQMR